LYASNFSIGVNLFFKLTQTFAHWMKSYPDYRVYIEEIHHTKKKDHPSGTALSLADILMQELTQYQQVDAILEQAPNQLLHHAPKLPVLCYREGEVPGTHVVRFENEIDRIELKHEAFGRTGFASGAVDAAIWIGGRQGVFTVNDMLGL
jgi:4-hydroxy-tetrahydrodipicolinate reductase